MIAQVGVGEGGLGFTAPGYRAAPDFVLSMVSAARIAAQGVRLNDDLEPVAFHPSISDLFLLGLNPGSLYLQRFENLLAPIASISCPARCPVEEQTSHFLTKVSTHSARSRIRKHCSAMLQHTLYDEVAHAQPDQLGHLPSLLDPSTSYPLVSMCRSAPTHRLQNWNVDYAILRKLRLPIYDPSNCPKCWCGKTHDCYGDHAFSCVQNNKKMAHNLLRDSWATALQPAIAAAGLIHPTSKLHTEKANLVDCDPGAAPLDFSFDPDPSTESTHQPPCPFPTIGGDISIVPPTPLTPVSFSEDVISTVTAAADKHLQKRERSKYMRANKTDEQTKLTTRGERVMEELVTKNVVLIPFAIDPLGRLGPLARQFLYGDRPNSPLTFPNTHTHTLRQCTQERAHPRHPPV